MRRLRLYIQSNELVGVEYYGGAEGSTRCSVRGKTAGAFKGAGSFQWTTAVRALALFFLNAVEKPDGVHLLGGAGSLAASLDYALSKQPIWIAEMFGTDSVGNCIARRFVARTNSERKRPGPVCLSLNRNYLDASMIEVVINGNPVTDLVAIAEARQALSEGDGMCPVAQLDIAA